MNIKNSWKDKKEEEKSIEDKIIIQVIEFLNLNK